MFSDEIFQERSKAKLFSSTFANWESFDVVEEDKKDSVGDKWEEFNLFPSSEESYFAPFDFSAYSTKASLSKGLPAIEENYPQVLESPDGPPSDTDGHTSGYQTCTSDAGPPHPNNWRRMDELSIGGGADDCSSLTEMFQSAAEDFHDGRASKFGDEDEHFSTPQHHPSLSLRRHSRSSSTTASVETPSAPFDDISTTLHATTSHATTLHATTLHATFSAPPEIVEQSDALEPFTEDSFPGIPYQSLWQSLDWLTWLVFFC